MAFQLDGIFVGATRGQDMRNAMIFSAGGLGILRYCYWRHGACKDYWPPLLAIWGFAEQAFGGILTEYMHKLVRP